MDSQLLTGLAAVAGVVIVAMIARGAAGNRPEAGSTPTQRRDSVSEGAMPEAETLDREHEGSEEFEGDEDDAEVVAITSDNYAIVPDTHAVRLVPPDESGEAWKPGPANRRGALAQGMSWHAGDFTGARVVRGAADEGPWRMEAMGRDGEYTAFIFETRDGADAALQVFESRGVVSIGTDEEGNPSPPSAEQFEEARRVFLETEAELTMDDPEERP